MLISEVSINQFDDVKPAYDFYKDNLNKIPCTFIKRIRVIANEIEDV